MSNILTPESEFQSNHVREAKCPVHRAPNHPVSVTESTACVLLEKGQTLEPCLLGQPPAFAAILTRETAKINQDVISMKNIFHYRHLP